MVHRTPVPKLSKHRQVRRWFLDQVAQKNFQPGQLVPGETELMAMHKVSRATVRRAMDELEFEGLIRRHRGKGSFLLSPGEAARKRDAKKFRWGCLVRHWVAGREGLLSGIEALAERDGHEVILEYVGDDPASVRSAISRMLKFGVNAMLVEPTPYLPSDIYRPLVDAKILIVSLDAPIEGIETPVVTFDHRRSAHDATRFLLELKHRRIGYVSSPRYWTVDQQVQGWRDAMEDHGIKPLDQLLSFEETVADERSFSERGFQATLRLLSLSEPPSAIIAINDETAVNTYRAIKSRGLRIPHDISVIAIISSHRTLPGSMDPPLTVWQSWPSFRKLGERAAEILNRSCQDQIASTNEMIVVEPAVMPRGSVSLAPHAQ